MTMIMMMMINKNNHNTTNNNDSSDDDNNGNNKIIIIMWDRSDPAQEWLVWSHEEKHELDVVCVTVSEEQQVNGSVNNPPDGERCIFSLFTDHTLLNHWSLIPSWKHSIFINSNQKSCSTGDWSPDKRCPWWWSHCSVSLLRFTLWNLHSHIQIFNIYIFFIDNSISPSILLFFFFYFSIQIFTHSKSNSLTSLFFLSFSFFCGVLLRNCKKLYYQWSTLM